jgi:peptidoglycan endopeptidase LytE
MKIYAVIVAGVLALLLLMPIIALSSITDLSLLAISGSGPDTNIYLYQGSLDSSDHYAFGNCTYWVYLLRQQIADPIPNSWGNAITWATRAKQDGYLVNQTPTAGSIMQDPNAPGGLGHVAFVESVNPANGQWTISEMNRVGFDEVDTRIMPASSALSYYFIHDKQS